MRRLGRATGVGALIGVAAITAGAFVRVSRRASEPVALAAPEPPEPGEVIDWCARGLDPIPGGGCFAIAPDAPRPAPLVVYLHGMYDDPHTDEELDRQKRLAAKATARGFALLALRGRQGECRSLPGWWCWPSNERTAEDAPAFVAAWASAIRAAEKRAGAGGKRYVLGFSNGGYFAGLLAVRAHFPAHAFVVAHGGPVEPVRALGPKVPLLLMSADEDYAQTEMIRFSNELARDGWTHETWARGGGHALTDEDIETALVFFARASRERLPLSPPLAGHKPPSAQAPRDAGGATSPIDAGRAAPSSTDDEPAEEPADEEPADDR